jgi:hypothetical protein
MASMDFKAAVMEIKTGNSSGLPATFALLTELILLHSSYLSDIVLVV